MGIPYIVSRNRAGNEKEKKKNIHIIKSCCLSHVVCTTINHKVELIVRDF